MILKFEPGRRGGDDRIIANGGGQVELDELTEALHKASHGVSLQQQVKGKTTEGDDRINSNSGRQDGLDKLTETSHKASHEDSLWQQVKGKTTEGDEEDQWTKLIGR